MEVIELAQKLKTLNYVILRSEFRIIDGVDESSIDFGKLALDAGLNCEFKFSDCDDDLLPFNTHTQVKVEATQSPTTEDHKPIDIFLFELEFNTSFVIELDGSDEQELKQSLLDNEWIVRRRNAIISHFLGESVLQKTPFKSIRLPLN
ncbi:hypothetical protein ACQ5ES_05320 [Pseudidiomarina sp. E22-M8]|uniref:hypothetical protein n=1 Tax=Pseudidiomarina sp. E22-M8 TaxID=3424768 RepID=UPI00403C5B9D